MVLKTLSDSDLDYIRKIKYPNIINFGVNANVLELTGAPEEEIVKAGYYFLSSYQEYLELHQLDADQLKKIGAVLPSVSILGRGAKYSNLSIGDLLNCRSAVQYIVDDFTHMNDLLYTDFVLNFDELLEEWRLHANAPFTDYYDFYVVKHNNALECHPRFHSWWTIGENVKYIREVPVEEAKEISDRQYADRKKKHSTL